MSHVIPTPVPSRVPLLALIVLLHSQSVGCREADAEYPVNPETGLRVAELPPVPPVPDWEDNPATAVKDHLGRLLFFDIRLSGSGTGSCPACHAPTTDFQSSLVLDLPDRSLPAAEPTLHRNTPTLTNLVYAPVFRWDGSHGNNLYEQLSLPFAEANMNLTPDVPMGDVHTVDIPGAKTELRRKLLDETGYAPLFEEAFGVDIHESAEDDIWLLTGKAIAVYLRNAVSRNGPFDRWNQGEDGAISNAAIRGMEAFKKSGCTGCHYGALFTDYRFHNISTSPPEAEGTRHDEGRFIVTELEEDRGKFLTPSLRNVAFTSPYMHDGSFTGLREVMRFKVGEESVADPLHDPLLKKLVPLTPDEQDDVIEFMKTLVGEPIPRELLVIPSLDSFP